MNEETENTLTEEEISRLVEDLEIDLNSIKYITLLNGTEIIAEIFDNNSKNENKVLTNSILCVNAYKIAYDRYVDFDGDPAVHSYFTDYQTYSDDPYVEISKNSIASISNPSNDIINLYFGIIKNKYYPESNETTYIEFTLDFSLDDSSDDINSSNIIDFSMYKNNKRIQYI